MRITSYITTGLVALASCLSAAYAGHGDHSGYINYTTVTGIFLQDNNATDPSTFNFTATNFGLINQSYPSDATLHKHGRDQTPWQRLQHYITTLNSRAPSTTTYKLLFIGRHGEGFHNAAETYYGTPAWNCFYSELDGNSTVTWADAHLTQTGIAQALAVNAFWKNLISQQKIRVPERYYTSPLYRCLQTANLTFTGVEGFRPEIKELFREGISGHTCDRRSNKTFIHTSFPSYTFEKGFAEMDPLWEALHGETTIDQDVRSKRVLDDVFADDDSTYISITSHSGETASMLRVLGHRVFGLSTGAAIPVLVKAVTVGTPPVTTATQAYTALATCTAPPTVRESSCNDCSCCK